MTDQITNVQQPEQNIQLQINDILLAAQTIQVASTRGAFRVEEFTQVGGLYDRLIAFLQASGAIKPATSADAQAAPTQGN